MSLHLDLQLLPEVAFSYWSPPTTSPQCSGPQFICHIASEKYQICLPFPVPCFAKDHTGSLARPNILQLVAKIKNPGYADLKIIIPPGADSPEKIKPTLVFVDNIDETGLIVKFLRAQLPECLQLEAEHLILPYSADFDDEVRQEYMRMLNCGQTRVLVCTDACGMGLNITCVVRVFQWKVLEVLCPMTLTQRVGRGGRDASTQAVAMVFVQPPLIKRVNDSSLDDIVVTAVDGATDTSATDSDTDSVGNPHTPLSIGHWRNLPVNPETISHVKALCKRLRAKRMPASASPHQLLRHGWQYIDDDVLWYLNTTGCRQACMLSIFDDFDGALKSSSGNLCCDPCIKRRYGNDLSSLPADIRVLVEASVSYSSARDEVYCSSDEEPTTVVPGQGSGADTEGEDSESDVVTNNKPVALKGDRKEYLVKALHRWRDRLGDMFPRHYIHKSSLLSSKVISALAVNAARLRNESDVQTFLERKGGYKFPESLLTCYLGSLMEAIQTAVAQSEHLVPVPPPPPEGHWQRPENPHPDYTIGSQTMRHSDQLDIEFARMKFGPSRKRIWISKSTQQSKRRHRKRLRDITNRNPSG